jgi:hypothetical protein
MPYAQLAYNQELGNGKYTIAQAGCFLTADCNLLEGNGITVDPPTLNAYFKAHNVFLRDPDDGANEDLAWGSVSVYTGGLVHPIETGSGWPKSANAIVKFYFKAHNGQMTTHFCKMYSADKRLIVDSYDGKVKTSPYGDPIAYAIYAAPAPSVIVPYAPPITNSFVSWVGKVTARATCQVRAAATDVSQGNLGNVHSDGLLHPGDVFDVIGYQWGQDPYNNGKHFWLKTAAGHWVWAYNTNFFELPGHGAGNVSIPVAPASMVTKGYGSQTYGDSTPQSENEGPVPVRRIVPDPNKWMQTYDQYTNQKGEPTPLIFNAKGTHIINDLSNPNASEGLLRDGMTVEVAGEFKKDGIVYYRTTASEDNHTWYGIEPAFLTHDSALDQLLYETINMSHKEKLLAGAGTVSGKLSRLFRRKK